MGSPFPFPDEPGAPCIHCAHLFPGNITPKYLYVDIQGVAHCPLTPPHFPNINGVHRLEQDAIQTCLWRVAIGTGIGDMVYTLHWIPVNANFGAVVAGVGLFFDSLIHVNCNQLFPNQIICFMTPPFYAHGGTAEIFWGP